MVTDRRTAATYLFYSLAGFALGCKGRITMSNELSLDATFTLRDEELLLTYEVKNRSKRDIYLTNRLYSDTPTFEFSPERSRHDGGSLAVRVHVGGGRREYDLHAFVA